MVVLSSVNIWIEIWFDLLIKWKFEKVLLLNIKTYLLRLEMILHKPLLSFQLLVDPKVFVNLYGNFSQCHYGQSWHCTTPMWGLKSLWIHSCYQNIFEWNLGKELADWFSYYSTFRVNITFSSFVNEYLHRKLPSRRFVF